MNKWLFAIIGITIMVQAHAGMKGAVDFKTLTPPSSPNYFLVCPDQFCAAKPQQVSPVYPVDARTLYEKWANMVKEQVRTELVYTDADQHQYQYVQRSRIFRFPDYVNVQFIELGSQTSTLAIYSRSKYGYSDMGVNKKRVLSWLDALNKSVKPIQSNSK